MKRKELEDCVKENKLIETNYKDTGLAEELLNLVQHRLNFWNKVEFQNEFPSLVLEGHYEIIKELATAILALDGWNALDHECLFAYLKNKKKDLEIDFDFLLELKDTRNSIGYRGVMVSANTWTQNKLKIQITIKTMQEYMKNKL